MWKIIMTTTFLMVGLVAAYAQPVIYNDATSLVTGTWNVNGTINETNADFPYEGINHYRFIYSFTGFWAGFGLNLASWGADGYDFSGYSHLRIAYRGMEGDQRLTLQLRSDAGDGNSLTLGSANTAYAVVDLPLFALAAGTNLTLNNITELAFGAASDVAEGSGTLFIDAIQLVDISTSNTTSAATWQRANSMHRGINYNNWLEAYWLIPFNAYPEVDKFNAAITADFRELGFDAIRLPVTFENLADEAPPYTLDTSNPAFGLIDDAILWAANNNMKLIIDMHHGVADLTNDNYQTELPRLIAIWEQIIDLYGDLDPERYLFEVYNEPHAISNDNFKIVAENLVEVLRDAGSTHSVIVGASGYNSASELLSFTPLDDPDIIYTFHFYEPYFFTHQQMSWTSTPYLPARGFPLGTEEEDITARINAVGEWSAYYNAPVVAGEFGVTSEAAAPDRCNWITLITQLFEDNGLPWFYWGAIDLSDGFGFFTDGEVNEASMVPCFGTALGLPATILAVEELSDLSLTCETNNALLEWSLKTSEAGRVFVEALTTGSADWATIGEVEMRPDRTRYGFRVANDLYAYRLKIVEADGTWHYSSIRKNDCIPAGQWSLFPNPVQQTLFLQSPFTTSADLVLYNNLGQVVHHQSDCSFQKNSIFSTTIPPQQAGIYFLEIRDHQQVFHREKVLIE